MTHEKLDGDSGKLSYVPGGGELRASLPFCRLHRQAHPGSPPGFALQVEYYVRAAQVCREAGHWDPAARAAGGLSAGAASAAAAAAAAQPARLSSSSHAAAS